MGARIAMKRLAKMNLGFASARRLDFTIGQMSGERQVPATRQGYGPGERLCQCPGRRRSAAVMAPISNLCWARGPGARMGWGDDLLPILAPPQGPPP